MYVMNQLTGLGATIPVNNSQVVASSTRDVHRLQRVASGSRLSVTSRGMGNVFAEVPTWVWAGAGGLVGGLVLGAIYFKRKR